MSGRAESMRVAPDRRKNHQYERWYVGGFKDGLLARNYNPANHEEAFYFAGYLRGKRIRLGTPILRRCKNSLVSLKQSWSNAMEQSR